jgi:glycerol-3-phosphate dehydrogenase subunit C
MPLLEQGRIADVASNAAIVAAAFGPWIDKGYDIIALVPSCALMLKFEWPLILPGDPAVEKLSKATFDVSEYIVDIAKKEGLIPGMKPVPGTLTVHMACHARAQNMGQKAAEMLRLIPDADVKVIERCSGHGGSWGFKKDWFDVAMKVGRPVARQAAESGPGFVMSECPLAGVHIAQGMERQSAEGPKPELVSHPVQLLARAYGFR